MPKPIFRKVSLEQLASPEQLDQRIKVTTPISWAALLGAFLLIAMILVWGFFGEIPTVSSGGGILIKTGGVVSVVSPVAGQVSNIYVEEGELAKKGQIIGRMSQPKLLDEIRSAKKALSELQAREQQISLFGSESLRLKTKALDKEKENLAQQILVGNEKAKWLSEKVTVQEKILDKGLITRQALIDTKTQRNDVLAEVEKNRGLLKTLESRYKELENEQQQQILESQESINEAKRMLALQEAELEFSSRIISSNTGKVVEVRGSPGQAVNRGEPILTLELIGQNIQDLQAVIYMAPEQGKQIKPGMLARITPLTVKREEHGYMMGIVTKVAEFPSSSQGMSRVLKNEKLVEQFSENGAPIPIYVDFIPDSLTPSGYKWSSSKGPIFKIDSGTLCQGSVEIRSQDPISLVIPFLKKQTGID